MTRTPNRTWTADDEALLRRLWDDGVRGDALANALGRSVPAAHNRALLLGLRRHHKYGPLAVANRSLLTA